MSVVSQNVKKRQETQNAVDKSAKRILQLLSAKDEVDGFRKSLAHKLHRSLDSPFEQLLTGASC
jgi:hypothetical protein